LSLRRVRVNAAPGIPVVSGAEWLRRIGASLKSISFRTLKPYGPTSATATYRVELPDLGTCWLKEYRIAGVRKFFSPFRVSRAERVWRVAGRLLRDKDGIPKPLLTVEERWCGFLTASFLVTEWLEERTNLAEWYRQKKAAGEEKSGAVRERVFRALRAAAEFHRRGVIHGDLKWSNFLLPVGGEGDMALVDLDAARFDDRPASRGKDLARFAISALEEGMGEETRAEVFAEYLRVYAPADAERVRSAYEGYLRRKLGQGSPPGDRERE